MTATEAPSVTTTDQVLAEIGEGLHDGRLLEMADAIAVRLRKDGAAAALWRITLDGDTWDAESVTLGELCDVETITGRTWLELDPARSTTDFVALVIAHFHKIADMPLREAVAKAESLPQSVLVDALTLYEKTPG